MFISQVWDQIKIEFGFEHRATDSCPVAKRMSENFDGISDLRDLIYQLNVVEIQKQEISNRISITKNNRNVEILNFKQEQYSNINKRIKTKKRAKKTCNSLSLLIAYSAL